MKKTHFPLATLHSNCKNPRLPPYPVQWAYNEYYKHSGECLGKLVNPVTPNTSSDNTVSVTPTPDRYSM